MSTDTQHGNTAAYRAAVGDPRATEWLVGRPDSDVAALYVELEPNPAGGFTIWHSSLDDGRHQYMEDTCLRPSYRPDAASARTAAWDITLALLEKWSHQLDELEGFEIQVCDGTSVLWTVKNLPGLVTDQT